MWVKGSKRVLLKLVFLIVGLVVCVPVSAIAPKKKLVKGNDTGSEFFVVREIVLSGNDATKAHIILKELTFGVGDTIPFTVMFERFEKSKENLLNTSLFNYVYVTHSLLLNNDIVVHVKVEERWYLWAFPIFEQADRNISSFIKNGNWDMMNYGIYVRKDNFRGRQETVRFRVKAGYSTNFAVSYLSPEIPKHFGWGFVVNYNMYDKLLVSTVNNQPVYLKTPGETLYKMSDNQVHLNYRQTLYTKHVLTFSFRTNSVADSVMVLNNKFLGNNLNQNNYLQLAYTFAKDTRDNKAYPLKGAMYSGTVSKTGLAKFDDSMDYYSLSAKAFAYKQLGKKFDIGTEIFANVDFTDQLTYFNQVGIGYDEYVSGFEFYVVDANKYGLIKNRLLFELVPTTVKHMRFISSNKFSKIHYTVFLRTFFDSGYAYNKSEDVNNYLSNKFLFGYGAGLDLVTYYDKALGVYYAFNSIGEQGLFFNLHLKF
jgi:hypothetical protein